MRESGLTVTVFGLGEAGSLISADLAAAGASVKGFDPAAVPTPDGVQRHDDPREAVAGSNLVMAITPAVDAQTAIAQAWDAIGRGTVYADLSTAPPSLKEDLNDTATIRADRYVRPADSARASCVFFGRSPLLRLGSVPRCIAQSAADPRCSCQVEQTVWSSAK